jgi:hypothetical protein
MPRILRLSPSDLSDEEWTLLKSLLASSERRDRPPKWPIRRVADAVFYLLRSGCAWRMLPREYPPWQRPCTTTSAGGARDPSAAVIDSLAVKTTRAALSAATTARSASPDENATSWWTQKRARLGRAGARRRPPRPGRRTAAVSRGCAQGAAVAFTLRTSWTSLQPVERTEDTTVEEVSQDHRQRCAPAIV